MGASTLSPVQICWKRDPKRFADIADVSSSSSLAMLISLGRAFAMSPSVEVVRGEVRGLCADQSGFMAGTSNMYLDDWTAGILGRKVHPRTHLAVRRQTRAILGASRWWWPLRRSMRRDWKVFFEVGKLICASLFVDDGLSV